MLRGEKKRAIALSAKLVKDYHPDRSTLLCERNQAQLKSRGGRGKGVINVREAKGVSR